MGRKKNRKTAPGKHAEARVPDRKIILAAAVIAVLSVLVSSFLVLKAARRKPSAAFYGLSESERNAVTAELPEFTVITLDPSKPLLPQLSAAGKPDVLFTMSGAAADEAAALAKKNKAGLSPSVLDGVISSVRAAFPGNAAGPVTAVPILLNNYEIDASRSLMQDSGYASFDSWADLDKFVRGTRAKVTAPVVMAGGDDRELINIIGAPCEALQGTDAWNAAAGKIKASADAGKTTEQDFEGVVSELCAAQDSPLFGADSLLAGWYKSGILYPETFHMKVSDVRVFMENDLCAAAFVTLSQHRAVSGGHIGNYVSLYYPSSPRAPARAFTAPVVTAVPLSRNKRAAAAVTAFRKTIPGAVKPHNGACSRTGRKPGSRQTG